MKQEKGTSRSYSSWRGRRGSCKDVLLYAASRLELLPVPSRHQAVAVLLFHVLSNCKYMLSALRMQGQREMRSAHASHCASSGARFVCCLLWLQIYHAATEDPHTRRGSIYCAQEQVVHVDRTIESEGGRERTCGGIHIKVFFVVLAVVQVNAHLAVAGALQLIPVLAAAPWLSRALRTVMTGLGFIGSLGGQRCAVYYHGATQFIPVLAATVQVCACPAHPPRCIQSYRQLTSS
jgi:hypothetical protein